MEKQPYIIGIEGLDGAGKKTISHELKLFLEDKGKTAEIISFPMYNKWHSKLVTMYLNGFFGKDPVKVNAKLASLFYAIDRFFAIKLTLRKKLNNLDYIIFDRYTTSNMLYQASKASSEEEMDEIIKFILDLEYGLLALPEPDIVLFLATDVERSLKNMQSRDKRDIHEQSGMLFRAYSIKQKFIKEYGWEPVITSDISTGEMIDPKLIIEQIEKLISI